MIAGSRICRNVEILGFGSFRLPLKSRNQLFSGIIPQSVDQNDQPALLRRSRS